MIDGKKVAAAVRDELFSRVESLRARGVAPGLAVVQVGEDPASSVYVRNKRRTCEKLGIESFAHTLPADASQESLLLTVDELNADDAVHGILVQLPLPDHMDPDTVIERIAPHKDVDGFHPTNVGRLAAGNPTFVPCTPAGVMELLRRSGIELSGRRAVVVGRSNIVGKPMGMLLLQAHATVTTAHSRTTDLPALTRQADILVAAVGRAELIRGSWVKPGAVVIDVGIQRTEDGKLVGDVAFDEVAEVAGHITPVPGGVGPMTIAMLMQNTVRAAEEAGAS